MPNQTLNIHPKQANNTGLVFEHGKDADSQVVVASPTGSWRLHSIDSAASLRAHSGKPPAKFVLRGNQLVDIDTGGAKILLDKLGFSTGSQVQIVLEEFDPSSTAIFNLVKQKVQDAKRAEKPLMPFPQRVMMKLNSARHEVKAQIAFLGQLFLGLANVIFRPSQLRLKELVVQIESAGLKAIPILCLVNFLIGLVVAYLFASQAEKFGANIFIVDAAGMGMCRELSPMLVAIIIAGRSGSAYTAQIGTMKINEEIDAIRVLGLSAFNVLVMPRVLALIIVMPLLVFIGDIFGILGGVAIADMLLDITPTMFFNRLQSVLAVRHVWIGLAKAPVFALVIAMIACRMGLSVENNARSVGLNTTATVVQSIVAVILLDAGFAVLFQQLKW